MKKRNIVVIGASTGGIGPVIAIAKTLTANLKASIFIVVHVPPHSPSNLKEILNRAGPLKAIEPKDGDPVEEGMIYLATPDHHLLIENNQIIVKKGPKENHFRPSIDALFRSAAYFYGPRVIGIILSGFLDDGTSGLWAIKRMGGLSIIQNPKEAEFPDMPLNVLEYVEVDYILKASEIGPMITSLVSENASDAPEISEKEMKRMKLEIIIATTGNAFELGIIDMGKYTVLTCPECHGALISLKEGMLVRFRCHTGHAYTSSSLLSEITKGVDEKLWEVMRGMEETTILLEQISKHFQESGKTETADLFQSKAEQSRERGKVMHELTLHQEIISSDIRHE